jgi:hypothetical protein
MSIIDVAFSIFPNYFSQEKAFFPQAEGRLYFITISFSEPFWNKMAQFALLPAAGTAGNSRKVRGHVHVVFTSRS